MHTAIVNQVVYAAEIGGGGHGAVACGTNRTLHVAAFFSSVRKVNRSLGMVEPIVACGCEVGSVMQVVCVSRALGVQQMHAAGNGGGHGNSAYFFFPTKRQPPIHGKKIVAYLFFFFKKT